MASQTVERTVNNNSDSGNPNHTIDDTSLVASDGSVSPAISDKSFQIGLTDKSRIEERLKFAKTLFVDKVVDVSFSQEGNRLYLVRWEETWECEEDLLLACKDLLRDYWENQLMSHISQDKPALKKPCVSISEKVCENTRSQSTQTKDEDCSEILLSDLISMLPQTRKKIPTVDDMSVKLVKDIPEQYKNVGFAKSVREKFSDVVPTENNYDYVEQLLQRQQDICTKKSIMQYKKPREEIIREFVSYRNGTRVCCEICLETFADKKSLQRHKICRHDKYSPHQCPICRKMFVKPGDVRRHMTSHSLARTHFCCFCTKTYKTKNHLQRHIRAKHSNGDDLFTENADEQSMPNSEDMVDGNPLSVAQDALSVDDTLMTGEPLHDELNNPNDTVLHSNLLLQDTAAVLHNANEIIHTHPGFAEQFFTSSRDAASVQLCLIERSFF